MEPDKKGAPSLFKTITNALLCVQRVLKSTLLHTQDVLGTPEHDLACIQEIDEQQQIDPFVQALHHALADQQQAQEERERQWLMQVQQDLTNDAHQRAATQEHDIPARSFQSRVRGLQHWFARISLRDLKIVLFLAEAHNAEAEREFSLDEVAHALQMAPSTMKMAAIHGSLITSGVIQQTRHGRAGYRYRSGLLAFLHTTFPGHDQLEPLLPLLFYDTIQRRTKKTDPWLTPWLARYEQELHHIQERYSL